MTTADRVKGAFLRLGRAGTPRIDYLALYRARVISQAGDGTLGVQPDDPRLPAMDGLPIRHGLPGCTVKIAPGAFILVGWWNGDPSQPYVSLWEGGESVTEITIAATMVNVGGTGGKALVTTADFDNHIHSTPAGNSGVPTAAAVGTTNMKGK